MKSKHHLLPFKTTNWSRIRLLGSALALAVLPLSPMNAQPSGGPYGPIRQTYELPADAGTIYYVAPDGNARASGKSLSKPTTLESAIEHASTGDAIILRGGTYRTGNLVFNQAITLQPYRDEEPVLKGTFVADDWQKQNNGLWVTSWSRLFPARPQTWWRRGREGSITPQHRFNNDMVFVDGVFLQSAGWEGELDETNYYIDYETGLVYLAIDPTDRLVEITAFDLCIRRTTGEVHGRKSDGKGPTIRGITFTQYAFRAFEIEGTFPEGLSDEANHGKEVTGMTMEHCTISFCSRAAGWFRGDNFTMRHCKISDTSTEGVYLESSADVLFERNIFTRNNIEQLTGYYPAAVKIFNQCYRTVCNDNLVIDQPYSNGIWYDVGNVDGVFTNNWVEGVGCNTGEFAAERMWRDYIGFFFEISKGAVCTGNVFVNNGNGVCALNASNVQFYNNTLINSTAVIARTSRGSVPDHFGWHPTTGPGVDERYGHVFLNNLIYADKDFNRPLLYVWQPADLCKRASNSQLERLDYNIYLKAPESTDNPIIWWSPVKNDECRLSFDSLEGFRKLVKQSESHSRYYPDYSGPLFKSHDLGHYQLLPDSPGATAGSQLPPEISRLLSKFKAEDRHVGAYPVRP